MKFVPKIFLPLFFLMMMSCEVEEPVPSELPQGVKDFITEIQKNSTYVGTRLFRYTWAGAYYYEFDIPISSCLHCHVFNEEGVKIVFSQDDLVRFLSERGARKLMWEWKK
jgi:hypothetical protein